LDPERSPQLEPVLEQEREQGPGPEQDWEQGPGPERDQEGLELGEQARCRLGSREGLRRMQPALAVAGMSVEGPGENLEKLAAFALYPRRLSGRSGVLGRSLEGLDDKTDALKEVPPGAPSFAVAPFETAPRKEA